ncbi:hypothetical protein TUMSATVNIG1_58910 (plasmid) [Vibrio nigripulchritudo]|nr:hypothetical protein VNTUMSATTG_58430 [Vibrio nigripulchritudo]BDU35282.1 hypothetical protein TUMSATVNIG1_58910 [Vibrio nigripulchritudo]
MGVAESLVQASQAPQWLNRLLLALIQRDQLLPTPSEQMEGTTLEFVVPIAFFIDKQKTELAGVLNNCS